MMRNPLSSLSIAGEIPFAFFLEIAYFGIEKKRT